MVLPGGTLLSEKAVTIDVNQLSLEFNDGELERDYQDSKQRVLFTFQGFQVCFAFCYLWSFSEVIYSTFWLGRVRFLYVWVTVLCFIAAHILPTQLKKIQASTMAKFRALNVFYLFFIVGCMGTLRLGTDYFQNDLGFGLVVGGFIGNCTFMGHLFSIDFRLFSACISLLCVASMILFYQRNNQSGEYLPEESRICFAYTYFLILSSRIVILQGRMNFGLMKRQAKENVRQKLSFISQLAHDIGTPLTAMSLATDCLKAARGEAERRDLMDSLDAGVQMLTVIRNEALSLAKVQAGADPEPSLGSVEVRPLLRQCAKIIEAYPGAPGLAFRFLVDPVRVPPALWTDLEWLSTMLINYLSNAKKYCPDGGEVRVALFVGRGPRGALPAARRNQKFLRVEVEDSGPGVPPAQRNLLFQPFSQLKDTRNGTGLGLFGVLTKAEKLGGTAGMHSNPFSEQGGSVFHFTFPLQDSQDKIAKDIDSTGPHLPLQGVVLFVLGEWGTEDQNTLREGNICYSKVEFCGGKLSVPPETYAGQQCVLLWRTDAVALLGQPKDMLKQTVSETFAAELNVIGLVLVQQCTTRNTAGQSEGVCAVPTHSQMIRARKQCGLQQKCFPFPLYLLKRDWKIMDVLAAVDSRSFQGRLVSLRHRSSSGFCNSPVQPIPPGGYRDTLAVKRESTKSTILLVDDSFTVIQLMDKLLTKKGIRIQHATNGEDGLQLMKQAAPLGVVCGLVDMSMPVLDGFGCLSQYRAWEKAEIENGRLQRPPMVLIAFTAQVAEYSITKILEAGADGVLAKPFHFHSLAGLIKQFHSVGRSLILNPKTFFSHQPGELSASLSREVVFPEYSPNDALTQQQRLPLLVRPKMRVKVLTGSGKRFSLKNNATVSVNTSPSLFAETSTCSFADTNVRTNTSNKNKERIAVVIDDSPTVCKMVSRALTQEGYHVKVADDGIPGLQLLKRVCAEPNPSIIRCDVQRESEGAPQCSGEEFVFCLCDLQMPKMGGLEVIQHFRAWEREQGHKKEALIFAFSANADEIVRHQVMQAGATAIISKPFKLQTLKDLLTKHHYTTT